MVPSSSTLLVDRISVDVSPSTVATPLIALPPTTVSMIGGESGRLPSTVTSTQLMTRGGMRSYWSSGVSSWRT